MLINYNIKSKFAHDVLWNLAAFSLMGITGIVLNLVIARYYGPSTLGVFNQVFSLYIILSQFAILGTWLSVLKHTAEYYGDEDTRSNLIVASLFLTGILATITTLIGYLLSTSFGKFFGSEAVMFGWLIVLPGFWCYSINKVFMAILNGSRNMRAFAIVQILRYLSMLIGLVYCVYNKVDGKYLPVLMSYPESFLFVGLLIYTRRYFKFVSVKKWMPWCKIHFLFGLKGFMSGTLAELNTKVDVIMLGYFTTDSKVGVYSMAAMIAEGISQLAVVLRDNINPIITKLGVTGEIRELEKVIKKCVKNFYFVMVLLMSLAIIVFPMVVEGITGSKSFHDSWGVFSILAIGISLSSGYLPINMLLNQLGYPGLYTVQRCAVVVTNFLLNLAMIPFLGIYGAAIATSTSYVCSVLYLKYLAKKSIGLTI